MVRLALPQAVPSLQQSAAVVLACRSVARGEQLAASLRATAASEGRRPPSCEVGELDLASLASVRAFAAAWEARQAPLHGLVNNAGIFSMGERAAAFSADGHESHWATNFLVRPLQSLASILLLAAHSPLTPVACPADAAAPPFAPPDARLARGERVQHPSPAVPLAAGAPGGRAIRAPPVLAGRGLCGKQAGEHCVP
jgi:NAD(P)-dependent dehydrogenase (short-subunit alcohol dehydrogenase family)